MAETHNANERRRLGGFFLWDPRVCSLLRSPGLRSFGNVYAQFCYRRELVASAVLPTVGFIAESSLCT